MAKKKNDLLTLGTKLLDMAMSEKGQKVLFGTYSNGRTRSAIDAWRDETISPKDREKWEKKKKKKEKKRKKDKKKKSKTIINL